MQNPFAIAAELRQQGALRKVILKTLRRAGLSPEEAAGIADFAPDLAPPPPQSSTLWLGPLRWLAEWLGECLLEAALEGLFRGLLYVLGILF